MGAFVETFVFNQMKVNTFVLHNDCGDCVLIDPGCETPVEQQKLAGFLDENRLKPVAILLTHGHFDHVAGASFLVEKFGCDCWLHPEDEKEIHQGEDVAQLHNVKLSRLRHPHRYLNDGEIIQFGQFRLKVLHIPGHTGGSVAIFEIQNNWLFAGDTLVKGSLGFSNLGYGELMTHLKNKILPLPDETIIFCGHGPTTTIEQEKKSNPFFRRIA